jgi:hypothetical protein
MIPEQNWLNPQYIQSSVSSRDMVSFEVYSAGSTNDLRMLTSNLIFNSSSLGGKNAFRLDTLQSMMEKERKKS